jgi:RNA polymerase sigma-70 factor (ECF subfamily)
MKTSTAKQIFGEIYDKYVDKIYRFIFLKVNSQEIAEDITSETFLRGWEAFLNQNSNPLGENDPPEIENMQAFLYQIARNLTTDFYREKGKTQLVSTDNVRIIDPRLNLEEKLALKSDLEQVRATLTSLKEDYQEVIILHYINDLSISEIAKTLNKPEGTIRVTLHRGLKELKKLLS